MPNDVEPSNAPILLADVYWKDGDPNWDALSADGRFHGAILKATEGLSYDAATTWFPRHFAAVRAAGGERYGQSWFRGAYHYLIFSRDPAEQARYFLQTIQDGGGWDIGDLIPIVDVERGKNESSNHQASAQQVIDCTSAWVETIKSELGCAVMLYGRGAMQELGISHRMGCDYLWNPTYRAEPIATDSIGWTAEQVALWQYTDGEVNLTKHPTVTPGVGAIDVSVYNQPGGLAAFRQQLLWKIS